MYIDILNFFITFFLNYKNYLKLFFFLNNLIYYYYLYNNNE